MKKGLLHFRIAITSVGADSAASIRLLGRARFLHDIV
jgi:hypothetical protein